MSSEATVANGVKSLSITDINLFISDYEDDDDEIEIGNNGNLPWKNAESELDMSELNDRTTRDFCSDDSDDDDDESNDVESLPWTHNFKTFTGSPLPFTGETGPTIPSTDPYTIFTSIWDENIMNLIAKETNKYAKQLSESQKAKEMPDHHISVKWTEATVDELFVMFSLYIFAGVGSHAVEDYIFGRGSDLVLPAFLEIMPLERFLSLNRCLHFVDNNTLPDEDTMLAKIKPLMDHCNEKFASLYQPRQFMDIGDSLFLAKDIMHYRAQATCIGIKTYELCEVFTGYVLKIQQYTDNNNEKDYKQRAQIILDLVKNFPNRGHRIVTDKYFSSVYLARTLKSKGFDFIGEIKKSRKELPQVIQDLEEDESDPELYKLQGNKVRTVSRHCGDMSVVAWSEWDVTVLSTYHTSAMRASKRGVRRPAAILDYIKVREKIAEKDEDLADYIMLKRRFDRWYINQFKQLLNISIRNSYIIYKRNAGNSCLSQVKFRHQLANKLLDLHGVKELVEKARLKSVCLDSDDDDESSILSDSDSDCSSTDCTIM